MNGGELVAATLAAHGVEHLFTLCGGHISPILVAAKRARHPGGRRPPRGRRGVRRRRGGPADRAPRRGGGDRRPGGDQHHHRGQERPARAVAGGAAGRRDGDHAQGAGRAAGHRPDGARRSARQVGGGGASGCASCRRRSSTPCGWPPPACRGRCSSSARSTCSTTRELVGELVRRRLRQGGWPAAPAAGIYAATCASSSPAPARRKPPRARPLEPLVPLAAAGGARRGAAGAGRAAGVGGRQPGDAARRPVEDPASASRLAARRRRARRPHLLGGMARGLLGRRPPAADPPPARRQALREADLVILAGVSGRLPARLRPPDRPPRHARRRQPAATRR